MLGSSVRQPLEEASAPAGYVTVPARDEGETRSPSPRQPDCCIVGGGPAGIVLGLLLAREVVSVTLLEAHKDFDREFRGNTISPSVMEVMGELGLANSLLELRHAEIPRFTIQAAGSSTVFADFQRLKTRYPYVLMLPQTSFLELVVAEARRCPNFRLVMGARVKDIIRKGGYRQLRAAGLPALRRSVAELAPELADRVGHLKDWKQGSLLSVESDRLSRWYREGLLLIGDAAHVASPVGGVGINLAIQDAVVAANVLAEPLKAGRLRRRHLKAMQRRRQWPTRLVQGAQVLAERWVVSGALASNETFGLPIFLRFLMRTPLLRDLFARLIAFGAWPVHARANSEDASVCPSGLLHPREATYA